jgi:aspartyl-tRNA(Asn)/glutamyl-tRNA(Gln) amidotransferase subunit B
VADIIKMVKGGQISGKMAKEVFEEMYKTGKAASDIVKAKGLSQISDEGELAKIVEEIVKNNPDNVAKFKAGKTTVMGFFVGEIMKATKGKANPQVINKLLKEKLEQ